MIRMVMQSVSDKNLYVIDEWRTKQQNSFWNEIEISQQINEYSLLRYNQRRIVIGNQQFIDVQQQNLPQNDNWQHIFVYSRMTNMYFFFFNIFLTFVSS